MRKQNEEVRRRQKALTKVNGAGASEGRKMVGLGVGEGAGGGEEGRGGSYAGGTGWKHG